MLHEDAKAAGTVTKQTGADTDSWIYNTSKLRSVGPKVLELFQHDSVLRQLCGYLLEEQSSKGLFLLHSQKETHAFSRKSCGY